MRFTKNILEAEVIFTSYHQISHRSSVKLVLGPTKDVLMELFLDKENIYTRAIFCFYLFFPCAGSSSGAFLGVEWSSENLWCVFV